MAMSILRLVCDERYPDTEEKEMSVRAPIGDKRINRLKKRVEKEVYIFPKKNEYPLNRLIKKIKKKKPKTLKQQMKEWNKFQEMTK